MRQVQPSEARHEPSKSAECCMCAGGDPGALLHQGTGKLTSFAKSSCLASHRITIVEMRRRGMAFDDYPWSLGARIATERLRLQDRDVSILYEHLRDCSAPGGLGQDRQEGRRDWLPRGGPRSCPRPLQQLGRFLLHRRSSSNACGHAGVSSFEERPCGEDAVWSGQIPIDDGVAHAQAPSSSVPQDHQVWTGCENRLHRIGARVSSGISLASETAVSAKYTVIEP